MKMAPKMNVVESKVFLGVPCAGDLCCGIAHGVQ